LKKEIDCSEKVHTTKLRWKDYQQAADLSLNILLVSWLEQQNRATAEQGQVTPFVAFYFCHFDIYQ
jgi:hypothetical protein